MHSDELEEAFSDFLDRHEYEDAEAALFSMVRLAFVAGWRAAGGDPPRAERLYELIPPVERPRTAPPPPAPPEPLPFEVPPEKL